MVVARICGNYHLSPIKRSQMNGDTAAMISQDFFWFRSPAPLFLCFLFFFLRIRRPPRSPLFPYPTLFRSSVAPPLPPAPVSLLRNRSGSLRQLPTEATVIITPTQIVSA